VTAAEFPTIDDVRAAARVIDGHVVRTATARSPALGAVTGAEVWVKFEQQQYTSSFKDRGARNRLEHLTGEQRRRGVIAVSAGNHAQGLAHHATQLGIAATIVMPTSTPIGKVTRTRALGGRVILHGESFEEAGARARDLADEHGYTVVPPFDDPLIIAGQGTTALEMLEDAPPLDVLVVPIGGGGLIAGMATVVRALSPSTEVVGVEAEGYAWAAARRAEGGGREHSHAPPAPTVAEGIAVKAPGRLTSVLIDRLVDDVLVVRDQDVERAVGLYLEVEKVVAEGAGAATLAALLANPDRFAGRRCGVVLSGGNIDLSLLATIAMRDLALSDRILRVAVTIDDRPGSLSRVVGAIAAVGGNIVDLQHVRHRLDLPARRAILEVEVETADAANADEVVAAVRERGFEVMVEQ
jgi:threonine dehydratase